MHALHCTCTTLELEVGLLAVRIEVRVMRRRPLRLVLFAGINFNDFGK